MEKITWSEFCEAMRRFNDEHGYTTKGNKERLKGVVVFTQDSFGKQYTEKERSYKTDSDQKYFLADTISNSIFADCLDGKDLGVRLDWYMWDKNPWKVEYCYLIKN